jgi:carbamoyl-phosphate synthase large subunit
MPASIKLPISLAGRAPALLRHGRRVPCALPARSFTSAALRTPTRTVANQTPSKRLGTVTVFRSYSATSQPAPNAQAYLDSGVIKPQQNVDVKKVLVIGSGGLAIGQAGEFDYSGMSISLNLVVPGKHQLVLTESPLH